MAVTVKQLIPRKFAENAQTTQYTASNATAIIDKFTVTNVNTVNVTFSVNLPESGESPGNDNLVIKARQLAPSEAYTCPELVGQVLANGGFISTLASAASSLVISCAGREITT